MNNTLASQFLAALDLTVAEASLIAVVAVMALAVVIGFEQRLAVFAAIAGVFALLISGAAA